MSVTTTCRAPAWRTTAAAMIPIGPAPVISTSSPEHGERERGVDGVAEGIEDRGHVQVDARRVLPDVRHGQRDELGERSRAVDADALGVRAEVPPAGHAVAAATAHEVALAADDVTGREVVDVRSDLDDLADELVADDHRHRDRALRPRVPGADVQVGAADAGALDADQHVVDADLRLRGIDEPDAWTRLRFRERFHAVTTRASCP